ncbi:Uma2 family endonuclease [Nocardiopsis sp. RSe5-2]|uniref:Uma2 family endonuclease n=1 Tax=Nocardiopsis endophytica TaxID=3018445 RepID=A0ABT4U2G1_9ACTN|nr:Uma2 family endonuclease [Nocardiopsis endophytica]MDA2811132.1 Uma2 family endonuclease [Nocardiopsis endophytica]
MDRLPEWATSPESLLLTEGQYDALPDQVRKLIEVIDGHVIFCQSGTPEHSDVARRLANAFETAKPKDPCRRVSTDIDVYFTNRTRRDGKLSFRRPDVSIYRCIERGSKVTTTDTELVVEVVSPGSGSTDTVDKLAEYANEGIAVYLVVFLGDDLLVSSIREYRLDWASKTYRLADTHEGALGLEYPFEVTVPFTDLDG